jgi:hypothetical protein
MEHGHRVVATDLVGPAGDLGVPVLRADLTDYGQAVEVLAGTDAVIHLANIPAPGLRTAAVTFNWNVTRRSPGTSRNGRESRSSRCDSRIFSGRPTTRDFP